MTLKSGLNFEEKLTFCWKNLTRAVENLCTLIGYFCQNYVMFELKKCRRVVPWKNDLWFQK